MCYTSRRFWNHRATDRVTLVMFTNFERGFVSVFIFNCQLLTIEYHTNTIQRNNFLKLKISIITYAIVKQIIFQRVKMTRHGRNSTNSAVYTYHERKKDASASGYGSEKCRLGKDSLKGKLECTSISKTLYAECYGYLLEFIFLKYFIRY